MKLYPIGDVHVPSTEAISDIRFQAEAMYRQANSGNVWTEQAAKLMHIMEACDELTLALRVWETDDHVDGR